MPFLISGRCSDLILSFASVGVLAAAADQLTQQMETQ